MTLNELKLFKLNEELADIASQWSTWTPTLTWATATPVSVTTLARFKVIGKTVMFQIYITATDGNGTTGLNITMPTLFPPKANNMSPNITTQKYVGATGGIVHMRLRDDGINNDIYYPYMGTATGGTSFSVRITGLYEIS
jgi:hypothetical protein